jgi:glycosyltransferase involved in cell wall biosynthesis
MVHNTFPLVTIAIPTYNRADGYLKNAIDCALTQTYQNVEVVISDNCSSDNTQEVVKGFNDPRIRYFRQSINIGANNNFNFCLDRAQGDYFLLLHDDDSIDSDFIDVCMRAANYSLDFGLIRTGMRRIDCYGNTLSDRPNFAGGLPTKDFFLCWFRDKTPMHLCMSLFNTRYLRKAGGFNSKHQLFQDVLAEVTLAAKAGRLDIEDVKASYRMHADQFSSSARIKDWCEDSILLHDAMCELIPQDRVQLEREGKKFFFRHNYSIAKKVKSRHERLRTYVTICHYFGYLYSLRQIIQRNFLYNVRLMKRMVIKIAVGK